MDFLCLLIQSVLSRKKNCQFIIVQSLFLIVAVVPDETSLITVFCDRRIPKDIPVLMYGIHIKQEDSLRVKVIIYQFKNMTQFIPVCNIIETVADTYNGPHHCLRKHLLGIVHTNHIITLVRKQSRHRSCSTSKFQYQTILDPIFSQMIGDIIRPFFIINIIHEQVIHLCKFLICSHRRPPVYIL